MVGYDSDALIGSCRWAPYAGIRRASSAGMAGTGCEFSVMPKFLAWAKVEGNLHTRAMQFEKWWDSVAEYGAGMRGIATCFCPYTPDALPSHVSVFSHDFKRFEQLTKLATSSV